MNSKNVVSQLTQLLDAETNELLKISGPKLIRQIGIDTVRSVITDVLSGKNLRDSTELITRARLGSLNAAMVKMLLEGEKVEQGFIENLPLVAERILQTKKLSKTERWLALWLLGLNEKASQNILRDDASLIAEYREKYESISQKVIDKAIQNFGELSGEIKLSENLKANLNWRVMVYMLAAVGSQTLAIRGSEKSAYGKLFERLVLGSLLTILGFTYTEKSGDRNYHREFWLSSQGEKRESDATALWEAGKGVRFDIGFIGRGNPEISLDKVTRFEREILFGRSTWYMATIIIVDRIGTNSRITELAKLVQGDIVQMSLAYWPQDVARILYSRLGVEHPLVNMSQSQVKGYIEDAMSKVPIEDFLPSDNASQIESFDLFAK